MKKLLVASFAAGLCGSLFAGEYRLPFTPVDRVAPEAVVDSLNNEYALFSLVRGVQTQCSFYGRPYTSVTFDCGAQRVFKTLRIAPAQNTDYWQKTRGLNISFQASADKVAWTELHNTGSAGYTSGITNIQVSGTYRYVRISGNSMSGCGMIDVLTDGPVVWLEPIKTWGNSSAVGAADDPAGPIAKGMVYADAGTMGTVRVFAATEDLGEEMSAWAAKGTAAAPVAIEIPAGSDNVAYSAQISGLKAGQYVVRAFVEVGGTAYTSEVLRKTVVGAKPAATVRAYTSASASKATSGSRAQWLNGVTTGSRCETAGQSEHWIVFDLKDIIDAGQFVSAVRIWQYSLSSCGRRAIPARACFGYDDGTPVTWDTPEETPIIDTATRRFEYATALPANITWTPTATPDAENWGYWWYSDNTIYEMALDPARAKEVSRQSFRGTAPRYLKVDGIVAYDVLELELRTSKRPSGLAIVVQ